MRIIIESNERGGVETPINESTRPAHTNVETMDGGAPSEALSQAVAEALPLLTEKEGMVGRSNSGSNVSPHRGLKCRYRCRQCTK
jgi:hypothetical protein